MSDWTQAEDDLLRTLYPRASWHDITRSLPNRTKLSILWRASIIQVHRPRGRKPKERDVDPIIRELKLLRERMGVSRGLLANTMNRTKTQVAAWENGMAQPKFKDFKLWVRTLECQIRIMDKASLDRERDAKMRAGR